MNRLAPVLIATATTLLLAACGATSTTSSTSTAPSTAPNTNTSSSSPTASPTPSTLTLAITVANGKITPQAQTYDIAVGTPVSLSVSSDVADEVHVHGVNIEKQVKAGGTVTFNFVADQTGVFEIETHDSGLVLAKLAVQ